jgi:hypothetical protein
VRHALRDAIIVESADDAAARIASGEKRASRLRELKARGIR